MLVIILTSFSVIFVYSSSMPQKIDAAYIDFIFLFLMPFVLFRAFDILKPWPINWLDSNIKGALGVMIDDVAAALFCCRVSICYSFLYHKLFSNGCVVFFAQKSLNPLKISFSIYAKYSNLLLQFYIILLMV